MNMNSKRTKRKDLTETYETQAQSTDLFSNAL